MSEPEYPNQTLPDPLLGDGACIDADRSGFPEYQQHEQADGFESMPVIDAIPISMLAPEDASAEATPKVSKRRNMEEMAKRPSWLPEYWRIDLRIRSSGASAGLIDRYFFDPSGRKFRSKQEVLNFLETGNKLKRNADDVPSGSKKSKKRSSNIKNKTSKTFEVDAASPSDVLNNVQADSPRRTSNGA